MKKTMKMKKKVSVKKMSFTDKNLGAEDLYKDESNYEIKDLKSAIWAFEKLKELEEQKENLKMVADGLIKEKTERIQKWLEDETTPLCNSIEFFNAKILEYYRKEKQTDPKFKLSTPYGKVNSRTSKKWNYDEEELIKYIKKSKPELLRIKEEVNKTDLKKLYPDGVDYETGEIISGVDIELVTTETVKVG